MSTVYDVTEWVIQGASETVYTDIGYYINDILADIKANQSSQSENPAATIYIPPGDYNLKTRVVVDVSYVTIKGSSHGFFSSSIRYNTLDTSNWKEIWPGGSRIKVNNTDGNPEAFLVYRSESPRLSSVVFRDICLDGISFDGDQNSYVNGKIGIHFLSNNDACVVEGVGFVYLEDGLICHNVDAMSITNNFIAECGGCVYLTGSGQASKVTDNLMGAGYNRHTIYAENHTGLLVEGNNIFPRGANSVYFQGCNQCSILTNRFHAFYPGMVVLAGISKENLIGSNHFYRQDEPFDPLKPYDNGLDDLYGLLQIAGDNNFVNGNYFDFNATPVGTSTPTIILIKSGDRNNVNANHVMTNQSTYNAVVLDGSTTQTTITLTGTSNRFTSYAASSEYAFLGQPVMGTHKDLS